MMKTSLSQNKEMQQYSTVLMSNLYHFPVTCDQTEQHLQSEWQVHSGSGALIYP